MESAAHPNFRASLSFLCTEQRFFFTPPSDMGTTRLSRLIADGFCAYPDSLAPDQYVRRITVKLQLTGKSHLTLQF